MVYEDDRNGDADLYLNDSTDGGANWPRNDTRVDLGSAAGSTTADSPRDLFFNRSLDGGATWQPTSIKEETGIRNSEQPRICCDGGHIYVVWDDARNLQQDVFFNGSTP